MNALHNGMSAHPTYDYVSYIDDFEKVFLTLHSVTTTLGIMKRLFTALILTLTMSVGISADPYALKDIPNVQLADRSRYTTSPDGILSEEAVTEIDRICDSLHTAGIAQIAVVAVRDIASDDVFTFAHRLFSSWGVGSKENDNGLGIILVLDKREIRFVTGYGLEGVLPDAICKRIQQEYMVGPLGDGDYDKGMVDGVKAVASLLTSGELPAVEDDLSVSDISSITAIVLLIILILYLIDRRAHRCPKCRKYHLKHTRSQIIKDTPTYQLVDRIYFCPDCKHTTVRQIRISKSAVVTTGGGSGRGGFGGGSIGGGFGGGRFGGGGAGSRF